MSARGFRRLAPAANAVLLLALLPATARAERPVPFLTGRVVDEAGWSRRRCAIGWS